jgi:hypothetical protein
MLNLFIKCFINRINLQYNKRQIKRVAGIRTKCPLKTLNYKLSPQFGWILNLSSINKRKDQKL